MESSTVIAFRALVMLACLIVVPLAAIFGSQFPDVVKSVLVDRIWPALGKPAAAETGLHPESPAFSAGPAPSWQADSAPLSGASAMAAATGSTAPGSAVSGSGVSGSGAPGYLGRPLSPPSGIEPASALSFGDGQVRHAVGEMPAGTPAPLQRIDGNSPPAYYPASANPAAAAPAGLNPAGVNPAAMNPAGPNSAAPNSTSPGQTPSQTDRFTWMEHRLREYGATYYLLETWVNGGERYRFFCQMALANNPGHTRNFEATDTDPLRAMGRVVEQVEAWRGGRVQ